MKIQEKIIDEMVNKFYEVFDTNEKRWSVVYSNNSHPRNIDGKKYLGFNAVSLSLYNEKNKYNDTIFITFLKAKEHNFSLVGEHGTHIVYYNYLSEKNKEKLDEETDESKNINIEDINQGLVKQKNKNIPFIKLYTVFNINQCKPSGNFLDFENKMKAIREIAYERIDKDDEKINKNIEKVLNEIIKKNNIKIETSYRHSSPHVRINDIYSGEKIIRIMDKNAFTNEVEYYTTVLHELTHILRLENIKNKNIDAREYIKDIVNYSKEEIVAETSVYYITRSINLSSSNIDNKKTDNKKTENNEAYIKAYMKNIKSVFPENSELIIKEAIKEGINIGATIAKEINKSIYNELNINEKKLSKNMYLTY